MRKVLKVMLAVGILGGAPVAAASAAPVPEGVAWTQEYIKTPDGESLHADVLRPKGLGPNDKTPVILSIGPYFGQSGQVGAEGAPDGFNPAGSGPSDRYNDFFVSQQVWKKGYTVVLVDLRGFGGSSGCFDLFGPGEQTDVRTAVEWAAAQNWSTGRVGMYGKSYDAGTGIAGTALRPDGLAAVVALQPVADLYRSVYERGLPMVPAHLFPAVAYAYGDTAPTVNSDPEYIGNVLSATSVDCQAPLLEWYKGDPSSQFWRDRNLAAKAAGSRVPTFVTTGFLDYNTHVDAGHLAMLADLKGPTRSWLGWWNHIRGTDKDSNGKPLIGRTDFAQQAMEWFDRYVKQVPAAQAPVEAHPANLVQSGPNGTFRSERTWPPRDAEAYATPLKGGTFADDYLGAGSADKVDPGNSLYLSDAPPRQPGIGAWTISPPLAEEAHLAGVPLAEVDFAEGADPSAAAVAALYDIDPKGMATLISRGGRVVGPGGRQPIDLYPTDWRVAAGHRLGFLVGPQHNEWSYDAVPTGSTIAVTGGTLSLPALRFRRVDDLGGTTPARLESWKENAPFAVPAETIAAATQPGWQLPPALKDREQARRTPRTAAPALLSVTVKRASGRRYRLSGVAPARSRLTVQLLRGRKVVARTVIRRVAGGRYAVGLRAPGGRRVSARVVARLSGRTFVARSPVRG